MLQDMTSRVIVRLNSAAIEEDYATNSFGVLFADASKKFK